MPLRNGVTMVKVTVFLDKRGYTEEASTLPLAVYRALKQHEKRAKDAKSRGDVVPQPLKKIAQMRGLNLRIEVA